MSSRWVVNFAQGINTRPLQFRINVHVYFTRFRDLFSEEGLGRRLKDPPHHKAEDSYEGEDKEDYEEDDDEDDNLSQENLREMYIAAVDLAIHKVGISQLFFLTMASSKCF